MGVHNIMDQARKIFEAIKKINSDAEFIIRDASIEGIEWHNGTTPISKADIETKITELPTLEEETTQTETDKSSGKQKLKDLGLTDAEIKALTGA
jgi:hypothetical protein